MTGVRLPPSGRAAGRLGAWARAAAGLLILALLGWQVGAGPFLDGVRLVDRPALLAALGLGALSTVCCAWRWSLVAEGLGVRLPLGRAVKAYYRSLFLNTTLPGGVVGDVHRAVRHGLDISDVRLAVRAVVLERTIGLTVQVAASLLVLLVLPSPVRDRMPVIVAVVAATGLAVALGVRAVARGRSARWATALRSAYTDVREVLLTRRRWIGIGLASAVVVTGQLVMFVVAARTAGADAPVTLLVPLTQLALLAMALPLNIAGWGPREGVAAWAFAAAGMTSTQGVTAAVTYGVLGLVAALPGAAVLLARTKSRGGQHA